MKESYDLNLPTTWQSLSDSQLLYFFRLLSRDLSFPEIETHCLFAWADLTVLCRLHDGNYLLRQRHKPKQKATLSLRQIQSATETLSFLRTFPTTPIRISHIGEAKAIKADFQGIPFATFIAVDNYYQGFLNTQNYELLRNAATMLYQKVEAQSFSTAHCLMVFYWITSLKQYLARLFPHFLQTAHREPDNLLGTPDNAIGDTLRQAMNAQIRALTGGDITKESAVLAMDTWRALTELDAKAKECEELRRKGKG